MSRDENIVAIATIARAVRLIICVLVAISIIAAASCFGQTPEIAHAYFAYTARAIDATKPDGPVSDKCENCNGTGRVGDGTVFVKCPVCDGTGKRVKQSATPAPGWPPKTNVSLVESPPAAKVEFVPTKNTVPRTVIIYCDAANLPLWRDQEYARLYSLGVSVRHGERRGTEPYSFRIASGNRALRIPLTGYQTADELLHSLDHLERSP